MSIQTIIGDLPHLIAKVVISLTLCALIIVACAFGFFCATTWLWPEANGSYNLGNNIYMMEWDGGGRIIVVGSNFDGKTCSGGTLLIPTYENQYDSAGNHVEYVIDAKSDDNWIIAKTGNKRTNQKKYYIVNKQHINNTMSIDDIVSKQIEAFSDSIEFSNTCQQRGIKIHW